MPINKLKTTSIEIDAVTADLIATGAITVADIADGEITAAKLHTTLDFSTKTFTMHNNHITQAMVTQHQGALSVTESQISDLQSYALASAVPTDSEIDTRADARITNALAGNVTITGNLTVNGTQTVLNTETLTVDDNIIVLNNNEAGTPSQNAGIEVERGTSDNVDIRWNETTDTWQFTNDGTTYTDIGSGGGASAYTIDTKTDNYTAVAGDLGKLIHFTSISADKTLTLTAASTLGAGWFCFVRYSAIASGAAGYAYKVIIDPNGSETIDGETTRKMKGGQTFQILCDGSNFHILSSDESRAFSHNVFYNGVGSHGQSFAQPEASGAYAIALGGAALSSGTGAVALGYDSKATGSHSFAGPNSTATGLYGVSLGIGSPAGTYSGARGSGSVAIGEGARASTSGSLAIGKASVSEGSNASAIGQSLASGQHAFAASIGSNSSSYGAQSTHSVAIGYHAYAHTEHSAMAIGYNAQSSSNMGISLGLNARSSLGQGAIALGQSNARGYNGLAAAIASNSTSYGSQHDNGVAIGYYAVTTAAKQIALGSSTAQVKISGAYTLPTADGASGQVLQTNGSGVLSFATAGGGGSATSAYAKFTYEISATVTSVSGADVNGNTLSYSAGNNVVEVFVNGVKQQEGSGKDYQATTGSSVVFTNNLYSGDLVDVVAYNMFDGGDFNFDGSGNLVFGDNKKAVFGAGNDLEIYWDGTHGRIANTAGGNLYLTAYQVNFGDDVFFAGASYDAFWDRSVNSFRFNDSAKAVFGTGSDLQIYHDSSSGDSIITEQGNGVLLVKTSNFNVTSANGGSNSIQAVQNGAVSLYHSGGLRLQTGSAGVDIHEDTDKVVRFTGAIGEIGSVTGFQATNTAGSALTSFGIRANDIRLATGSDERVRIDANGNVGIGTTSISSSDKLSINGGRARIVNSVAQSGNSLDNSTFSGLIVNNSNNANGDLAGIAMYPTSQYTAAAGVFGVRESQTAGGLSFWTGSNTASERMRIDANGKVGIGVTSPKASHKMTIKETATENASIVFTDTDDMTGVIVGYAKGNDEIVSGTTNVDAVFGTAYSSDVHLFTNNSIGLTLTNGGGNPGNVGISTLGPQFKLHVNKGSGTYAPANGVTENIAGFQTNYDSGGSQILTFANLDGNWVDGTSGADSAFGWVWGYQNLVRGGLVYDHRGTERMQMFSSYGAIALMTPNSADGDGVPTDSNMNERVTILPGGNVGIGNTNPGKKLAVSGTASIVAGFNDPGLTITGGTTLQNAGKIRLEGAGTGCDHVQIVNDGNSMVIGVERSTGAAIMGNTYGYGSVIGSVTNNALHFGVNNTTRMRLETSGSLFYPEIGNQGDLTFPICSVSNAGTGNQYMHVQFQAQGGDMLHIHFFGYDYGGRYRSGGAGGYIYNTAGQASLYSGVVDGHCVAVYQNIQNRVELVIDTGGGSTSNKWGSYVFFGGTDTITNNSPLTLVQYAWNASTARMY